MTPRLPLIRKSVLALASWVVFAAGGGSSIAQSVSILASASYAPMVAPGSAATAFGAANNRLKAMRNKLALIEDLISGGDTETACEELSSALLKTDGQPLPPDFIQDAGAADLAAAIQKVQSDLGCK